MRRAAGLAIGVLFAAGCTSPGVVGDGADPAAPQYPAGPYGQEVGQVLPDFTVAGYRLARGHTDSTELSWDTGIKLSEYHDGAKCGCLLITLGAPWCAACQQEQPQLVKEVYWDPEFCVLGVVQEGTERQDVATKADVDAWTQHFNQNFNVVQGTATTRTLLSGSGGTFGLPSTLVVNPSTMKVLDVVEGYNPAIHDAAAALCSQ